MRFEIKLTDGVTSQMNLTAEAAKAYSHPQPIEQVKDILQANGVDVGVHFYSVSVTNSTTTEKAKLYLETSMQNTDATDALWEVVGESDGFDLKAIQDLTPPLQQIGSITADLGRYFRWRIAFDAATPPISASVIFEITVLGRG